MSRWPLLACLDEDARREVLASAVRRRFKRGEVVFHEGDVPDSLHLLDRGHAAVQVATLDGDTAMLRILGPGDYFGELALVSPAPRSATIAALDALETLSVHRDAFARLLASWPAVAGLVTEALVDSVRQLTKLVRDAYFLSVPERTVQRLGELSCCYPAEADGTVVLPITQAQLAQLVGTARPTVNRVLQDLQDRGAITVSRGRIRISPALHA